MHVPVFIDIGLDEQAEELRAYFKGIQYTPFSTLLVLPSFKTLVLSCKIDR
jgi:hypothetical protein